MQLQVLFLALAPALVASKSMTWYSDKNCTGPLGHIDFSDSSAVTQGSFDSDVAGIFTDSMDQISISYEPYSDDDNYGTYFENGNLIMANSCAVWPFDQPPMMDLDGQPIGVYWKYWD